MDKMKKNIAVSAVMIFANLILFFVKLYIGLYTGSICIYTDAVNNLTDCLSCVVAAVGFYILSRVKNGKYPFGFGKAEDVVNFIMSAVIIVAGCTFAYSSLERVFYPVPVAFTAGYAYLLAGTVFIKGGMAVFLHFRIKKEPSEILSNMRLDSILDMFISLVTVMSFTVSEYTGLTLDGIVGIVISVMIVIGGVNILIPSVRKLMGRRDDGLCNEAVRFFDEQDCSVNDVQCHYYGNEKVFTACVDQECDIADIINKFKNRFGYDLFVSFKGK